MTAMRLRLPVCALLAALPLAAEWQAAAYLGAARTLSSALTIEQPALGNNLRFSPVSYRGESFTPPLYYGYRAGWFANRRLGLEAEFIHLKAYAAVDRTATLAGTLGGQPVSATGAVSAVVSRFNMSHGVNLLFGNVVLRRHMRRFILAARLGAGITVPHVESTILGQADEHYERGSPAFQLAGGSEYRLWSHLHALGEYKYTYTREHVHIPSGSARTLLQTHHGVFGLAWHF